MDGERNERRERYAAAIEGAYRDLRWVRGPLAEVVMAVADEEIAAAVRRAQEEAG